MKETKVLKFGNYHQSNHNARSVVDPKGIATTVMENHGTVTAIAIESKEEICGGKSLS